MIVRLRKDQDRLNFQFCADVWLVSQFDKDLFDMIGTKNRVEFEMRVAELEARENEDSVMTEEEISELFEDI